MIDETFSEMYSCLCQTSEMEYFVTIVIGFLKRLVAGKVGEGGHHFEPRCSFLKIVSSKQRVKPWVFVTFKIIIRHIFPENFIEIPQVVQKLWRISLSILAIFINFYQFFGFFDISLLQRN